MLIRVPRGWELKAGEATPEGVFAGRRKLVAGLVAGALLPRAAWAQDAPPAAARSTRYTLDRPLTEETLAARHNVFDEFTGQRDQVWKLAAGMKTDPWRVHVGGAVEKALSFDLDDLVRLMGLEERLYRHRCVEAWSMAVPWTGFPLARFVELCRPLSKARHLRMLSVSDPSLPGWYATKRVFPYHEALTLAEAKNELAFLATGIYGRPLPPQHGAPLRLAVPWKYGLKSLKSIVAFQFTEERPGTFWNDLSPRNYTWESNVLPHVPHPWPQTHETPLGSTERRETLPYNGYAEFVAHLYA